jgi:hypothetical protein
VEVEELEEKVEHIESIIDRLRKRTATLTLSNSKGESIMDGIVHINDAPGLAVYQEFDAQGKKVPPTGAVAYASDTPAVATVDPVTGQLAYLTAGTAIITASDAGSFAASATLTVINSVAATATLTLPNTAAPVQ